MKTFSSSNNKKKESFRKITLILGYITIICGTLAQIIGWKYAPYLFCAGGLTSIAVKFTGLDSSNNFRIKRLNGMMALSALMIIGTGYFMFIGSNNWALTLALAAIIDIVVSFRYPSTTKED